MARRAQPSNTVINLQQLALENAGISGSLTALSESINSFESESNQLQAKINKSLEVLHSYPVLAVFLNWANGEYGGIQFAEAGRLLLDANVIQFFDSKKKLVLVKNVDRKHIESALEEIRGLENKDLTEKEMLVTYYLYFMNWLRSVTCLYELDVRDPDKQKTASRELPFKSYIKFLTKLDDRCQLVAKLLYFGGSRTLGEVLNLGVTDFDYKEKIVRYGFTYMSYPSHVFEDAKKLTRSLAAGSIFIGRNHTVLNAATVFRNFKIAASKSGLGDDFSPKNLTTDI